MRSKVCCRLVGATHTKTKRKKKKKRIGKKNKIRGVIIGSR
jgi:hypothetical protein